MDKQSPDTQAVVVSDSSPPQPSDEPTIVPDKKPESPNIVEKKKEEDKVNIYKALAIKLKKELVKSREEHQKLRDESVSEINDLKNKLGSLEEILESERQTNVTNIASLEAQVRNLKQELVTSDTDLKAMQCHFEAYKVRASKIIQQNNQVSSNPNKTFEEELYKQLKELNETQAKRISNLEAQLSTSLSRNKELDESAKHFHEQLEKLQNEIKLLKIVDSKCEALTRENENLKLALKQYRTKLKDPSSKSDPLNDCDQPHVDSRGLDNDAGDSKKSNRDDDEVQISAKKWNEPEKASNQEEAMEDNSTRLSPSVSIKDESHTTSSSSYDGSTSGYVHIKPTAFEIISRSSVLEDAQNQIDNLTKAYLDSENTNSLLSDQVKALKDEIRRMQRGTERLDLAENLEYLKNIVFKFLSLDSGQIEQKQRLVPVLSTVLKLSPDETAKLNSITCEDKPSMASSFFKL